MLPYTQLRKDSRLDLAAAVPLAAPLTVYVEPTNMCNLSCSFCPQSLEDYEDRTGKRQHMEVVLFEKVIREISLMGIKSLKLYFFGEPLLHPEIGKMVAIAKTACERVELTTNGIPLGVRKAQELIDAGLDYLRVSLYDDNPDRIFENVYLFHKLRGTATKPHICIKTFSADESKAARLRYEDICDEISHETLHTMGSDLVQVSQQAKDERKACPYPFYTLVVKSNGDVVPCCVAWEDSLIVGNVKDQTLAEIWAGEPLARIHRLHLEGRRGELAACAKCDTLFNSPDNVDGLSVKTYNARRTQ